MSSDPAPLVTVGLLSYCRPEGLRRVLSGLVEQSYQNLDIVVSDNGSAMAEVEAVLADFEQRDGRVRVFRQAANIGVEPNHTFVVRQARGEYFLWLHDDDDIPPNYIERCVARFSDSPNIQLVGPRADAYMEGRYWYTYQNFSNVGQSVFQRLKRLIVVGYSQPSAFQQYFFGVFRRDTLVDSVWQNGKYFWHETFSMFFRIADAGYIHFADDVTVDKYNVKADLKKWRDKDYWDKPMRYKLAGSKAETLIPMTLNIFSTVLGSKGLVVSEKIQLCNFCLVQFLGALFASREPWWKRILRFPFRLLRRALHLASRAVDKILG